MRRARHLRAWHANPHQAESRKEKSTKGTRASTRGSVNRQQGRPRPARHTQGVGGTPRNNSTRRRNERSRGRTAPRKEKPAGCHGSHTKASHPGTITNSRHEAHERRPADAGMCLPSPSANAKRRSLPRTGGDVPGVVYAERRPPGSAPHGRGRAPVRVPVARITVDCPARAGRCPGAGSTTPTPGSSTPRARGCALRRAAVVRRELVYPPRAGMCRRRLRQPPRRRGLPPARGDVPLIEELAVPPDMVCPARAGMYAGSETPRPPVRRRAGRREAAAPAAGSESLGCTAVHGARVRSSSARPESSRPSYPGRSPAMSPTAPSPSASPREPDTRRQLHSRPGRRGAHRRHRAGEPRHAEARVGARSEPVASATPR